MRLRDLVLRVLLIATSSAIIQSRRLLIVRLAPQPARSLENIPDRWKMVDSQPRAPQVEIRLLKGHVSPDENWMFTNEYKYSGKNYDGPARVTSTADENKVPTRNGDDAETREDEKGGSNGARDNIAAPDKFIPLIGSRNIITAPEYCPKGERKDSRGRCRPIIM